jgi:ElaB/YqjD/DUF883 family membrane-anchored ribosome-binding protein
MATKIGSDDQTLHAERIAQSAHEAVDRIAAQAEQAERRIRAAAAEAQTKVDEGRERARNTGREARSAAIEYIDQHPFTALAVAFGAGVVVASLMRR